MGIFARNNNGDTIQAFPINAQTEEGIFTDKKSLDIDTIRVLEDSLITFLMRDNSTIIVTGLIGEDFAVTEDVISFTTSANVRIA